MDQVDMLTWLIENVPKEKDIVEAITLRVLIVNFAAIHTSTMVRNGAL